MDSPFNGMPIREVGENLRSSTFSIESEYLKTYRRELTLFFGKKINKIFFCRWQRTRAEKMNLEIRNAQKITISR